MHTPFYRALLVSGIALSFLAFTGCEPEATDEVETDGTETEIEMEPAEELDSLGNVIEDAASEAAAAVDAAADAAAETAEEATEAAGDAVEDAGDVVGDPEDDGAGQ
jgi:hypothetical protein